MRKEADDEKALAQLYKLANDGRLDVLIEFLHDEQIKFLASHNLTGDRNIKD